MKKQYKKEYQDIFVSAEIKKKKGGSLGAVLKLIQELAEFEEKIEEAADAQEMTENNQKITSFLDQMDAMYDVLFEMARGGIGSIRQNRGQLSDEDSQQEVIEDREEIVEKPRTEKPPVMMNVPSIPKM